MLEKAEREAKEAATAVSVARSRSTSHAARYSLPVGNNGGGYTRLLDDPEAGEQLSVADPAVSCTGVPPAEARDGDSVALTADQVSDPLGLLGRGEETEFSIAPASRQPYLSGKSDIHWIPMIDIVGGTKRVNLRFLLVSQRLHARVVCRLPLVLVLWFLLILLETAAFFVWAPPPPPPPPPPGEEPRLSLVAWGNAPVVLAAALTFGASSGFMFAAGLADPGGVPVSAAQRAQRAQVERVSTAIEERLDELAVKAAVLSQQGRHSEAVLFLREGKASTSRSYLAISPHILPCPPIGKALYLEQQRRFPDGFCTACVHLRPPRTHHCRITDRCVARYDHYCCYIGNSVGHNNYRWFFGFVWATALHAALVLTASASRLLLLAASLLAHHDPHHGPALLISRNLTTYEHIKQVYKGEDGVALMPDATLRRVYSTPLDDRQSPHPLPAACSPSNARPPTLPQAAVGAPPRGML
ncbi:hypothetical protein EMIHUDRAFT_97861 [Emiliania huxleyi CCMP1516]|uniref:Palmitoyltransferase n=2 Tax=Emiliania huxleyi TaxID=2903 RepID=A0A0D3KVB0_EMIH1|nr:hypothetical protein EMIHUDRAFT_97861 [Emiliania huxleyi CCMP1516]EOD39695.1 hypothetical protein EMIHUDRAFT_97861 [Emiliania huxleyi CCMP1516]|eukprot:XP_005792124.1 hypothetical protein EMIHUDRAFT_97861 [Emiliania huxleyi CCMP1516]